MVNEKAQVPKALQDVVRPFSSVQGIVSDKLNFTTATEESGNKSLNAKGRGVDAISISPKDDITKSISEDVHENDVVLEAMKRKEVLKLVGCMNATVGAKTAEQGLLRYVR